MHASRPVRRPVRTAGGMVSSSHPAVSLAGARVLGDGGNAVDAALAMAATSWLALPGQCGVGGDAFAVLRDPAGRVTTVSGSGFGPDGGTPAFYRGRGLTAVPLEGPLSVAVPGAVSALAALHAAGGSYELAALWGPAADLAERGLPCTAKTREDVAAHAGVLARDEDAAAALLPGGRVPDVGERLPQTRLADTIRLLAKDPDAFYTGSLAERAVAALVAAGAPFSGDEWAACRDVAPAPSLVGEYAGALLHATPLPTPGWMVLQQAALLDGLLGDLPWLGEEAVHLMASAARTAFADRTTSGGSDSDSWRACLDPVAVDQARARLRSGDVPSGAVGPADGDTTSAVAVDGEGRAVSLIHSLAFTFGARVTVPGTGVVLNNRLGRGAYLEDGHPNEVRPRRRPLHTLNAWLVTDAQGGLLHVGNTPGGDGQVQWNMQMLSLLLDHGLDPQQTVDAPRFSVFPGSDADVRGAPPELRCESRLGPAVLDGLAARGHRVRTDGPWDGGGSALVVSVDRAHGCLVGAADSRQDGVALGV